MKGIIFSLLEDFVCDNWGDEKFEEILSLCPLKTKEPFVGPKTYPDSDLMTIAEKTAEMLGITLDEALKAFGCYAFPKLAKRYPIFLEDVTSARNFLMSVNSVIHVEVRKLYPNATPPEFSYQDLSGNHLIMSYSSKRGLCSLVEGFIDGVSSHFDTPINTEQTSCTKRGDACCEFDLRF